MAEHILQFARLSYSRLGRLFPSRRFRVFALIVFAALVVSGFIAFAFPVAAQNIDVNSIGDAIVRSLVWLMLQVAGLFIQITIFFLRLFILIAGYNDYINAPVVILGWNMVRDVANMFFIVVLMVIAFGTILGLEQYEWRRSLVKLVLAAILVNFSNMIVQLMIDVVQVFVVTFLNAVAGAAGGNIIQMFNYDKIFDIVVGDYSTTDGLLLQLFGAGLISLVFAGIAMFTLFAYVVVILGRMVTLWLSIILSPLMFLLGVLPQTKKYADEYWNEVQTNLLSAPVMVFFLWLAFATFGGGGGVVAHIEDDHALKDVGKITNKTTSSGDAPSASFNEAASWANMANFAVAIAFLWLGIDRVQKLGVVGGGMLSGAKDFGKKVATIASGYAAGRWLYEGGADLGGKAVKGVANSIPLVGGAALNEYKDAIASTYKRKGLLGVVTGGRKEGLGGAESRIRRSQQAKKLEAEGGVINWLRARAIEPTARVKKRSEDWKAAAERFEKIEEESYSTSSSNAGQAKLDATAYLKKVEEKSSVKGAAKVADRYEEAEEMKQIFSDLQVNNPGLTDDERYELTKQEYLDSVQEKARRVADDPNDPSKGIIAGQKARKKAEKKLGAGTRQVKERLKLANRVDDEISAITSSRAASENSDTNSRRRLELAQAVERDKIRAQKGLPAIFEPATRDRHNKEIEDELSGLSYKEITEQAKTYIKRLQSGISSPDLIKAMASTLAKSMKAGSEQGMAHFHNMLTQIGFSQDEINSVDSSDLNGKKRLLLSALLGEKLVNTPGMPVNLDAKFNQFIEKAGGTHEAQAALKNLDAAVRTAGNDGALGVNALLDDRTINQKTGQVMYKLLSDSETHKHKADSKYRVEEMKISNLTDLDGILNPYGGVLKAQRDANGNVQRDANGKVITTGPDPYVQEMVLTLFNSVRSNTTLHSRMVNSLKELYKNRGDNGINYVLNDPKLSVESKEKLIKIMEDRQSP